MRGLGLGLLVVLSLLVCPTLRAEDKLTAGDLYNADNSIELHMGDGGVIDFMKIVDNPGPSYVTQRGMDVVAEAWQAHGPGIVTKELIKEIDARTYRVEGEGTFPATVRLLDSSLELALGTELYRISRPKDYLVEVWPRTADGKPEPGRRFAYTVAKNGEKDKGFLGIADRTYLPRYSVGETKGIDWLAVTYPRKLTFSEGNIETYVYEMAGPYPDQPTYRFHYELKLSRDREVNLQNYLVLLSRRADNPGLFIHPVILSLLYYDSLINR